MHAVTLGQWGEGRGGAGVLGDDARVLEKGKSVGGRFSPTRFFLVVGGAANTSPRAARGQSLARGDPSARGRARQPS